MPTQDPASPPTAASIDRADDGAFRASAEAVPDLVWSAPPDGRARSAWADAIASGEPREFRGGIAGPDGVPRPHRARLTPLLERLHGQDVRGAHDGASAIEQAEAFRPDLILLDIGLPGLSGYEVAERLRARPEFASTRIAALTGWGQEDDRRRSAGAGMDVHLVKPVDPDVLLPLLLAAPEPGDGSGEVLPE